MKLLVAGHLFCPGRKSERATEPTPRIRKPMWGPPAGGGHAGSLSPAGRGKPATGQKHWTEPVLEDTRPEKALSLTSPQQWGSLLFWTQRGVSQSTTGIYPFLWNHFPLSVWGEQWLSNWPSGLKMPDAVTLINNHFTEIYSYSQTVEISRNKSLGRESSREETGIAKVGCFFFSLFKNT